MPIAGTLREHLAAERLRQPPGVELCFGLGDGRPFSPGRLQERADEAWKAAGFTRLTLHDCRHTFASFAIAAGVNAKALSSYMGHSGVSITLDRYGHLMPGKRGRGSDVAGHVSDSGDKLEVAGNKKPPIPRREGRQQRCLHTEVRRAFQPIVARHATTVA